MCIRDRCILSRFILTIQVTGNEQVSSATILSQLRQQGVRPGVYLSLIHISPHHYDNAYHPTQPKAGDRVFFYHEGSTLLSAATGEPFTWEEVTDLTGGETLETTYFFRIDETAFHWSREVPQRDVYKRQPLNCA